MSFRLQFAAGFFGVQQYTTSYHQLIQIEQNGFNSTLAPFAQCPNSNVANIGQLGLAKTAEWANVYTPPIIKRLSKLIYGVNLTSSDVVAMQDLCAYEVSFLCGAFQGNTLTFSCRIVCCSRVFEFL